MSDRTAGGEYYASNASSTTNGARKSCATQLSFVRIYADDRSLKTRRRVLTRWHRRATPTVTHGQRNGVSTLIDAGLFLSAEFALHRLEEEIARMKKNQERRLHRKNAKIAKEGGTLMTLNRPIKPDTTVRLFSSLFSYRGSLAVLFFFHPLTLTHVYV